MLGLDGYSKSCLHHLSFDAFKIPVVNVPPWVLEFEDSANPKFLHQIVVLITVQGSLQSKILQLIAMRGDFVNEAASGGLLRLIAAMP